MNHLVYNDEIKSYDLHTISQGVEIAKITIHLNRFLYNKVFKHPSLKTFNLK